MALTASHTQYFPQLGKSATYEMAWDEITKQTGYQLGYFYDKLGNDHTYTILIQILGPDTIDMNGNIQEGSTLKELEVTGADRKRISQEPGDYDFEEMFKYIVNYCIKERLIKKPRNGQKIANEREDELKELKRYRAHLTTKIYTWKKAGKDVTTLEAKKNELNQKIKALR